jgi:choline monooxygenase
MPISRAITSSTPTARRSPTCSTTTWCSRNRSAGTERIILPKRSLAEADAGEVSWELLGRHSNIIYFFFPSTFLLWEGDHVNGFNVTPVEPASCATASWMLVPAAGHVRRAAEHCKRNWKIFWDAIDEDFALAGSMQAGLASGANAALDFGANEFACELFERAIEALVDAP